jgi:acetylornithine deacetylase
MPFRPPVTAQSTVVAEVRRGGYDARTLALDDKDLLSRLVAFDSTSSNSNLPIADFACEYLDRTGIAITRLPSPDGSKTNVVAVAGPPPQEQGGGLILCGHLDVVPADEPGWHSDPYRLTERDGTWVGRGACDMKGSIALAMNILAAADVGRLSHPLVLLLTYDEELGTLGAQHFAETWPADQALPTSVLVGEPRGAGGPVTGEARRRPQAETL